MNKYKLTNAIKDNIAGLAESFDLEQLLGDELAQEVEEANLTGWVEQKRDDICARIRKL
jgi:hypothetical protein